MRNFLRFFRLCELRRHSPTYNEIKQHFGIKNPLSTLLALAARGLLIRIPVGGARHVVYYLTDEGRREAAYGLQAKQRRALKLEGYK